MTTAYLTRIATAVPPNDVHRAFLNFATTQLTGDHRKASLFERLVEKGGIEHRFSFIEPKNGANTDELDTAGFYTRGRFPSTAERMHHFEKFAPLLAASAVEKLDLGEDRDRITHLVITSCTGFSAPGLDLEIIERCGLRSTVERTIIGFMGCYAAVNALKISRHIVRSEPKAKVLVISLELCTIHMKETDDLQQMLSFMLFADGCSASLVTAEPGGIALDSFHAVLAPDTQDLITWSVRDQGFDMLLSGKVPLAIHDAMTARSDEILKGAQPSQIDLWAVHPGGRSVLDAVERGLNLPSHALAASRAVLRNFGNMSSATVMFVLKALLKSEPKQQSGCAMAFGPGLVAETMLFHTGA
jgi:predicted naringenin-chalcone synthase